MDNFYEITDDLHSKPPRWFLGEPRNASGAVVNGSSFRLGHRLTFNAPLIIPQDVPGRPVAFTFAAFDMPVLHENVVSFIRKHVRDEAEFIPARVKNSKDQYFILNVIKIIDCFDEEKTVTFRRLGPEDHALGDVGRYNFVAGLRISGLKAVGSNLFRVKNYRLPIICSSLIHDLLEQNFVSGIKFDDV